MNTLYTNSALSFLLTLFATFSVAAQTVSSSEYDFLLSISEPVRFDLYDRSVAKEGRNVVPVASPIQAKLDLSHPLPQLAEQEKNLSKLTITEHLQLATAYRLRGDHVQAVSHYAQIVKLSKQAIHVFFYAQSLRATGQDLLADLYDARYSEGLGGALQEQSLNDAERKGIPAMIYGRVVHQVYGKPVPNVEVRLVNICTEEEFATITDAKGDFRFKDHPADCPFAVRFEKRFFKVVIVEAAAPHKDDRVDIELDAVQDLSFR